MALGEGNVLWRSGDADRPLIIKDTLLLAQADSPRPLLLLVVLDVAAQGATARKIEVPLPPGTVASVDDTLGRTFSVRAAEIGELIIVNWEQRLVEISGAELAGGENPKPEILSGVVRVDLVAGTASVIDKDAGSYLIANLPPDLGEGERMAKAPQPQFRSANSGYAMTSTQIADNRTWQKYQWTIWDIARDQPIGQIRDFQRLAPFAVVGGVLLQTSSAYERRQDDQMIATPPSLRAFDLGSGDQLWAQALRDTAYSGPTPE
ncbi:MAG: hypothetical protein KDA73_07925 [Rhodobacteraceae bacterium]|nr:hypothetical protein [Paracoccaceae bacterium]